jgi:hypothetical protein
MFTSEKERLSSGLEWTTETSTATLASLVSLFPRKSHLEEFSFRIWKNRDGGKRCEKQASKQASCENMLKRCMRMLPRTNAKLKCSPKSKIEVASPIVRSDQNTTTTRARAPPLTSLQIRKGKFLLVLHR